MSIINILESMLELKNIPLTKQEHLWLIDIDNTHKIDIQKEIYKGNVILSYAVKIAPQNPENITRFVTGQSSTIPMETKYRAVYFDEEETPSFNKDFNTRKEAIDNVKKFLDS